MQIPVALTEEREEKSTYEKLLDGGAKKLETPLNEKDPYFSKIIDIQINDSNKKA